MKNKTIIIVDDSEDMMEGIGIALHDEGYDVITINNMEVKDRVVKTNPDIILIDYLMPGKNGGEITKNLKEDSRTQDIPVLMISASYEAKKVAFSSGADDFMAKPFDLDHLIQKVNNLTT